ncbi:MAG: hypothetical protein OXH78_10335 [Acidimicrobiaceae bacterium]|nr:hypothetical protein [Acidimicrobiaceae bacterium]
MKRLKELEVENARLKRIVADKELEIDAWREIGRKNGRPAAAAQSRGDAPGSAGGVAAAGL